MWIWTAQFHSTDDKLQVRVSMNSQITGRREAYRGLVVNQHSVRRLQQCRHSACLTAHGVARINDNCWLISRDYGSMNDTALCRRPALSATLRRPQRYDSDIDQWRQIQVQRFIFLTETSWLKNPVACPKFHVYISLAPILLKRRCIR